MVVRERKDGQRREKDGGGRMERDETTNRKKLN